MQFLEASASTLDWGSVPSYFGGVAILITAATLISGRRADTRAQAYKVAAWVENQDGKTVILMKNASDLPITSARVEPAYLPKKQGIRLAKDDTDANQRGKTIYLPSGVGPGQTVTVRTYDDAATVRVIGFSFTDARGQHWRRLEGRLIRLRYRKTKMD